MKAFVFDMDSVLVAENGKFVRFKNDFDFILKNINLYLNQGLIHIYDFFLLQ